MKLCPHSVFATTLLACSALPALAQSDCYRDTVLADSPASYWRLGELAAIPGGGDGGTAADVIGAHAGTYRNGVTLEAPGSPRLGSATAARFAGTSRVDLAGAPIASSLATHTVELWFKADSLAAGDNFLYAEDVEPGTIFTVRVTTGGVLQYGIFGNTGWRFATGTTVITPGTWYYVAAVLDTTGQSLYLGSGTTIALEATNPATGPSPFVAASAEIGCGRFAGGATFDHFQGTIDEVAIYPKALTTTRMQERLRDRTLSIATQPAATNTCPGGEASFSVTASGDAPFSYQWRRNGDPIDGATTNPYTFTGTVYIQGDYDCVVTNACGSVTSTPAALKICVGDFDCSGGTPDAGDIQAFFDAWLLGEERADVDGSGFTPDATDIAVFFDAFLAGC